MRNKIYGLCQAEISVEVQGIYSPVPNNSPPRTYQLVSQIFLADISEIVNTDCCIYETVSSLVQTVLISYQFYSRLNSLCKLSHFFEKKKH